MRRLQALVLLLPLMWPAAAIAEGLPDPLSQDTVNAADPGTMPAELPPPDSRSATADPVVVKLEILLDRAGASPGVIDGFDGDNLRKAIRAFELMTGLPADGKVGADVIAKLQVDEPVIVNYTITDEDVADLVSAIPADYAEMAKLKFLGYTRVTEELGERFHMDEDLLKALNPHAKFLAGEQISVAEHGPDKEGEIAKIEADKGDRQLRAYDPDGKLLVAYPAI